MTSLAEEEPETGIRALVVAARHTVRALAYACARLPAYRFPPPSIPLPGGLRRIYCYHSRKTGGTTLAHAFLALGGEDPGRVEWRMRRPPFTTASGPYRFVYQDPPLLRRGHYFFGYGHETAELVRLPDRTFTITILRDPAQRVVSLYRYLADPRADRGYAFHALPHEREWARHGFGYFLERVSRRQLLNQLYMFSASGSVAEAAERIARCDRVLFTEQLDSGLGEMAAFLELPLRARRARQSGLEYEPSPSEASRLRELVEPEYQLLALVAGPAFSWLPRRNPSVTGGEKR